MDLMQQWTIFLVLVVAIGSYVYWVDSSGWVD